MIVGRNNRSFPILWDDFELFFLFAYEHYKKSLSSKTTVRHMGEGSDLSSIGGKKIVCGFIRFLVEKLLQSLKVFVVMRQGFS